MLRFVMTRNIVWGRSKVKMMVASTLFENCEKCLTSKNVFMLYLVGARFRERTLLRALDFESHAFMSARVYERTLL